MQRTNQNFFTDAEIDWLYDNWVECWRSISRKQKDEARPALTRTQALVLDLVAAFDETFPYRNPGNPPSARSTEAMKSLTLSESKWARVGEVSCIIALAMG